MIKRYWCGNGIYPLPSRWVSERWRIQPLVYLMLHVLTTFMPYQVYVYVIYVYLSFTHHFCVCSPFIHSFLYLVHFGSNHAFHASHYSSSIPGILCWTESRQSNRRLSGEGSIRDAKEEEIHRSSSIGICMWHCHQSRWAIHLQWGWEWKIVLLELETAEVIAKISCSWEGTERGMCVASSSSLDGVHLWMGWSYQNVAVITMFPI